MQYDTHQDTVILLIGVNGDARIKFVFEYFAIEGGEVAVNAYKKI